MRERLSSLGGRDFRLFFVGQAASQLGDWMHRVGLIVLIYQLTGQPAAVAALFLAQLIPRALLLPLGGVLADRFPKRRLMLGADLVRASLVLGFIATALLPQSAIRVASIYALVATLQVLTSIFNPARSATIPALVPEESLGSANALVETFAQIAMLLGPTLGAAILLPFGPDGVFIANAVTFLISAAFLFVMRLDEPARQGVQRKSILHDLREGAEAVRQSRPLRACIVGFAVVGALNLCLQATMVDLLARHLGRPAAATGTLLTLVGIGLLLGTWPTAWLLERVPPLTLLAASVGLLGLDTALIGLAPSFAVVAAAFVINGVLTIAADLVSQTTLGKLAPAAQRGRVFGFQQWILTLGYLVGTVLGGALPLLLGTPATIAACGLGASIAVALVSIGSLPSRDATGSAA